jgi:ribonuclease-3
MVRTTTLAMVAEKLGFGKKLRLSKGEAASGGRENQALLANTFEAVVGAIYIDSGFDAVVSFLKEELFPQIETIIEKELYKDFKSTLQERVQAFGDPTPSYRVVNEIGPDHDKEFTVEVYVRNKKLARGKGKSKQQAQQDAAQVALKTMDSPTS